MYYFLLIIILLALFFVLLFFIYQKKHEKERSTGREKHNNIKTTSKRGEVLPKEQLIEPKTILINIEYTEMDKNIFPSLIWEIDDNIKKKLEENIRSIPQIPINSMRLMNMLLNPESNIKEIVSLVSTHPVLSAKILQTVNSVYFSLTEKITSVGRAITLLGYNNVRALVFQETLRNSFIRGIENETDRHLKLWAHSAIVSACAGFLGKQLFQFTEYEIATAGLLHDIGKFYLINIENGIEITSDIPGIIKEEHKFGINHLVAGIYIANHWGLPEFIVKGIEYHHHSSFFPPHAIPQEYLRQSFVLCLSDLVAKAMGYFGEDEKILPILPEYYDVFKINMSLEGIITKELIKNIDKARATVESNISTF